MHTTQGHPLPEETQAPLTRCSSMSSTCQGWLQNRPDIMATIGRQLREHNAAFSREGVIKAHYKGLVSSCCSQILMRRSAGPAMHMY